MRALLVGVLLASFPAIAEGPMTCVFNAAGTSTLTIQGLCAGWKVYRKPNGGDGVIVCPHQPVHPDWIELREFYRTGQKILP